jgi:hypothetical protein
MYIQVGSHLYEVSVIGKYVLMQGRYGKSFKDYRPGVIRYAKRLLEAEALCDVLNIAVERANEMSTEDWNNGGERYYNQVSDQLGNAQTDRDIAYDKLSAYYQSEKFCLIPKLDGTLVAYTIPEGCSVSINHNLMR